jgi:hypothetical protein
MDMGTMANPFKTWAVLVEGLRDRFVANLGKEPISPYAGELLGQMAAIATRCDHLSVCLQRLQDGDRKAFDAFLQALEGS